MKYIKTYELNKIQQLEGNYVKIKPSNEFSENYNEFIKNNIGKIIEIGYDNYDQNNSWIYVHFDSNQFNFTHAFKITHIEDSDKSKEELIKKITTKKYNL